MTNTIDTTTLVDKIRELKKLRAGLAELKALGNQMVQHEMTLSNEVEALTQQAHSQILNSFHSNINAIIDDLDNEDDSKCSCCCCDDDKDDD
jgi:hypothetical protein